MSIACEWLILCERALVDQQTNTFTLVSCLEQVSAPSFPSEFPGVACVSMLRWVGQTPCGAPVPVRFRVVRLEEGYEPEVIVEMNGRWEPGQERARVHARFEHLRLREPGGVRFRLDHALGDDAPWSEGCEAWLRIKASGDESNPGE